MPDSIVTLDEFISELANFSERPKILKSLVVWGLKTSFKARDVLIEKNDKPFLQSFLIGEKHPFGYSFIGQPKSYTIQDYKIKLYYDNANDRDYRLDASDINKLTDYLNILDKNLNPSGNGCSEPDIITGCISHFMLLWREIFDYNRAEALIDWQDVESRYRQFPGLEFWESAVTVLRDKYLVKLANYYGLGGCLLSVVDFSNSKGLALIPGEITVVYTFLCEIDKSRKKGAFPL